LNFGKKLSAGKLESFEKKRREKLVGKLQRDAAEKGMYNKQPQNECITLIPQRDY
jgi:hypothetical protein